MRHLGLALYAEGPTDYRLLSPILSRLCADICLRDSPQVVEISEEVLALDDAPALRHATREDRIVDAARRALGRWTVLFVHTDADGDARSARSERTQPALERLRREFGAGGQGVAVVPVRESEVWALWDGDALRGVFGTTLGDRALHLPQNASIAEGLVDPKRCLQVAFAAARPGGRRGRTPRISGLLNAIGERVDLDRLRELSAFAALEADLRQALRELHVLR